MLVMLCVVASWGMLSVIPPPEMLAPEESLRAILRNKTSMYEESPNSLASFNLAKLSLPGQAGGCPLDEVLEGEDLEDLKRFSHRFMLSSDELQVRRDLEGRAKTFWTPELEDPSCTKAL